MLPSDPAQTMWLNAELLFLFASVLKIVPEYVVLFETTCPTTTEESNERLSIPCGPSVAIVSVPFKKL
ncbi:hypothetical protein NY2A_b172L [Paramecium bursaria Chlorella virus NY2A]|uniref:Uncharacterized protein b172L n=1 Tax=Paramecium bursaria Chlorella virus NY2A TaxID=46021 RepID=A7IW47_PBCVN|nr:hypothetical protein NY2A_b172L [Paramecium bursaria Chlorella virus NY2A]ABT14571.1 hypothetical protein NY2A_b172L [Paramecium bursaria Chlorella virus NY2A]